MYVFRLYTRRVTPFTFRVTDRKTPLPPIHLTSPPQVDLGKPRISRDKTVSVVGTRMGFPLNEGKLVKTGNYELRPTTLRIGVTLKSKQPLSPTLPPLRSTHT